MDVWITPDSIAPNVPKERVLAVSLNEKNEIISPEGGSWEGNRFHFKTRSFGPYTLMADTVKPRVKPFNIVPHRDMSNRKTIEFTISDGLSGIESYRAEVDGKWILMEYEYKKNRLTHYLSDGVITPGNHEIKVTVTDKAGNVAEYSLPFKY
ncbi:MAG: hypothetical protein D6707_06015 [Bacteroidetes bacterium]|nr:MAG: hypothetical protein D6707_06015 [Bacteroidota bacterium]